MTDEPDVLQGTDPRTGKPLEDTLPATTPAQLDTLAERARAAATELAGWSPDRVATLLDAAAEGLDSHGEDLVDIADAETALGRPRLQSELARTCGQLRAFAAHVRTGRHLEVIIDPATDQRPDVRRLLVPLGPVAVFGASNFPLAFSVPGGDTASALAAGCPVLAKAHPLHPATSARCATILQRAVADAGAPPGTVQLVAGGVEIGQALVSHPVVTAVGFTGSFTAGRALLEAAARRPEPIPVYAEMGSTNPVVVTADALSARGEAIADGLAASITLGTGQFCTKPGLVFVPHGHDGDDFVATLAARLAAVAPAPMLGAAIRDHFRTAVDRLAAIPGVHRQVTPSGDGSGFAQGPALLVTDAATLRHTADLTEEAFGPAALVVRHNPAETTELVARLPGALAGAVHAESHEWEGLSGLLEALRGRVGRIVCNGFPTGVAVTAAMHHGGPWPATSSPLHTSVGVTATRRFLRPVAYQDAPQDALPPALRDDNPWGVSRTVNGRLQG